jgi:flagellin-like protein
VTRGQSHVVGVAILLAVTVVSLGGLTATVADTVDAGTDHVAERQAATQLADAVQPRRVTGTHTGRLAVGSGRIETVPRTVRLLNDSGTVRRVAVDALVYRTDDTRAATVAGAVVRGRPGAATVVRRPSLRRAADTLVVGVATLGDRENQIPLRTNVSHHATRYPTDTWRVAIETATPDAVAASLDTAGDTTRRDFDDDGVPSVVVRVTDRRVVFVVHALRLEVVS